MNRFCLLLLFVAAPPCMAPVLISPVLFSTVLISPARADVAVPAFDHVLIAQVTTTALAFMAPRTLDAIPIPQMAAWGLRGVTAIDPRLMPEFAGGTGNSPGSLNLLLAPPGSGNRKPGRSLLARPAPADTDAAGWGEAVAQIAEAAWEVSDPVRRAGNQAIIRHFFDELFSHMDPYSRYAPPGEAERDRVRRAGLAGVGMATVRRGGVFVVNSVQTGGPAAQAGVRVGERILAIDGESTVGADQASVSALLAGPENSSVELTLRGRDGRVRVTSLERMRMPPETVTARRAGDMLLVAISSFSRNTGSRLAQELILAQSDPAPLRGVVIDLRGNRGGVLQQAVASAAMLQAAGMVAFTVGRAQESVHVFLADGRDLAHGLPVVVLVDGNSASAAEILAASLADQRRAVVVGSATLGKGLVQTVTELPDGGELLVSWSQVLAPLGWPIQGLGVLPQICTSLGPEVLGRQFAALGRGVQPMQAALTRHRMARAPMLPADVLAMRAACPAAAGNIQGGDDDLIAARRLIDQPEAYATALLAPPVAPQPPAGVQLPPGVQLPGPLIPAVP